jgi:hypothetical protein
MSLTSDMSMTPEIPDISWTHRSLPVILDAIPVNCKSLLDVGCGRGIIGALCRIYRSMDRLAGMDGFETYLEFCQKRGFYDETILRNLGDTPLPLKTREFEMVTCIEVIEHLEWDAGQKLLDELERIGSRVLVTTPNVLFQREEYDGNKFQRHLSQWRPRDFRWRGYAVYGAGNLNVGFGLRKTVEKLSRSRGKDVVPTRVRQSARYISETFGSVTRSFPWLSTSLLCAKGGQGHE